MKIQIKARFTDAVLFECEISAEVPERYRVREALQEAVKARADLTGCNLAYANLAGCNLADADLTRAELTRANLVRANLVGANLVGANLADADLTRADLTGCNLAYANLAGCNLADADLTGCNLADADLTRADLVGANLAGATYNILPATPEEAIANLDKVREIILDKAERLNMRVWHHDDGWKVRTCAEETLCGTTHCLAGWLQVCSTNEEIRKLPNTEMAGGLAAPIARHMFFESDERAINWLRDREYAKVES